MYNLTIILLLLSAFSVSIGNAANDPSINRNAAENLMSEIIDPLFNRTRQTVVNSPLCTPVGLVTGKSVDQIIDHYKGMADFIAANVKGKDDNVTDLGDYVSGYGFINQVLKPGRDISDLNRFLPQACKAYAESEGKMSWEQWQKKFNNDPRLALLGVLVQHGWVRRAIETDSTGEGKDFLTVDMVLKKTNEGIQNKRFEIKLDERSRFHNGVFLEDAFGLDLSDPVSLKGEASSQVWGRTYKTMAGMTMGLALWEKGYSRSDAIFASQKATLFYETADLLYDHLGKSNDCGIRKCFDKSNPALIAGYDQFQKNVLAKLDANPSVKKQLFGRLVGAQSWSDYIPSSAMPFDLKDPKRGELVLGALLLNFYTEDPRAFLATFGDCFRSDREELLNLFASGKRDIDSITKGALFVYDKRANETQPNPKWEGLIGQFEKVTDVCSAPAKAMEQVEKTLTGTVNSGQSIVQKGLDWIVSITGMPQCLKFDMR